MSSLSSPLIEGMHIPAFEAKTTNGKALHFPNKEGRCFILYFYPRDNTPGCTQESCEFGEHHPHFEKMETTIYGISRDSMNSHEKFKQKYQLPFELISDPDESLCNLFGVMVNKNMYGKKVRGIERSTFLIDKNGIIQKIWRKVKVEGHVQEVLQTLKNNK